MKEFIQDLLFPHWMMVAGVLLMALGFIGFAFRQNRKDGRPFDDRHDGTSE